MRVNAASLDIRDATTSTPGTLNDLTTDLIMANNNHTYKLFKCLVLNGIAPYLYQHLIKERAVFRPGMSCTTQHIADRYQEGMITEMDFVDLFAAYNMVNPTQKLSGRAKDSPLIHAEHAGI